MKSVGKLSVCLISIGIMGLWWSAQGITQEEGVVYVLTIDSDINPITAQYIDKGFSAAEADNAEAVIILLNTLGGLLQPTWAIMERMLNSPVPSIVYVHPRGANATSAGVFITYAANIAAMSPATNIGAAHPVTAQGEWPEEERDSSKEFEKSLEEILKKLASPQTTPTPIPETLEPASQPSEPSSDNQQTSDQESPERGTQTVMGDKILNDVQAKMRAIARVRGRSEEFVRSAIVESKSITEEEALTAKVVDLVCGSLDELLQKLDGREVVTPEGPRTLATNRSRIVYHTMDWRFRFLQVIAHPTIALALLSIGGLGITMEILHPGAIFPAVIGGFCIIVSAMAFNILPINYAGVLLILLAFVLFILELKIPSLGLLTIGGTISMIIGSLILIDSPVAAMRLSLSYVLPLAISLGLISLFLVTRVARALKQKPAAGAEGLVGMIGTARSAIDPTGTAFIHGELWNVAAEEPISAGEPIEVVAISGLTLRVRRVKGVSQ